MRPPRTTHGVPPGRLAPLALLLSTLSLAACQERAPGLDGGSSEAASQERPNVVVVMIDTLRADHLGAYGYERPTSPRLDAFARRQVLFEDAVAQAGCTFPSVNSLMTSRSPETFLGRGERFLGIDPETPTVAEMLTGAGYTSLALSASPIVRATPSQVNPDGGFDAGFEVFDEYCIWRNARCLLLRAQPLLDQAISQGDPFFLYLHFMEPHGPYRPPDFHQRKFATGYQGGKEFIAAGDPNPIAKMLYDSGPDVDLAPGDLEYLIDLYDEEILYFDSWFDTLLAELDGRGELENTLLIVASDHGEEFLEHEHIKHCRSVYNPLVQTPLIVKPPGVSAETGPGRSVAGPVENLDIVPTILDYTGVDPGMAPLEGRSLRPLIEGSEPASDRLAFASQGVHRAVFDGRYKLIYDLKTREIQLFDLDTDPGETQDLSRQDPETVRRLRRALFERIRRVEGSLSSPRSIEAAEEAERQLKSLGYLL